MSQAITVKPGTKIRLAKYDTAYRSGIEQKRDARDETADHTAALGELAYKMYAENRQALLLVLQGMDTAGKDGAIRNVMRGVDAQSCQVTSFKQPSIVELDHDFLWRVHRAVPAKGNIGIFNRSHYEDVLIVRVHDLVPEEVWRERYEAINTFERLLTDGGTRIVKIFLHISKEEQRERLQERLDNPDRRWKFSHGDLSERKLWDDYQRAYEDALTHCNTSHAPWHIVPADRKWHRNLIISRILRRTLEEMDPQFPPAEDNLDGVVVE